jgi:hypothetical protein
MAHRLHAATAQLGLITPFTSWLQQNHMHDSNEDLLAVFSNSLTDKQRSATY